MKVDVSLEIEITPALVRMVLDNIPDDFVGMDPTLPTERIACIKVMRGIFRLSLLEAKTLVDLMAFQKQNPTGRAVPAINDKLNFIRDEREKLRRAQDFQDINF